MNNHSLSSIKSLSLPRLKDNSEQQKKPFQEIHKVNWSVAPRCLVENHDNQPVIYICVHPNCSHATRLVCEMCFYRNHSEHNKQFLAIDEIKHGDVNRLRYWPFNPEYRHIYEFIREHDSYVENLVQDIKSTFEVFNKTMQNFLISTVKAIKDAENKYLQKVSKFYEKESTKQSYINSLSRNLQECFQLKDIQKYVRKLFSKQIRHDVFMKNMNKIFSKESVEGERRKLKQEFQSPDNDKGKDMQFDKIYFLKKQKIVIRNIEEQEKAIKEKIVTIDEADAGLEQIITQTVLYLGKNASGLYPLTFQSKNLDDGTYYQGFIHKNNRVLLGLRDYKNNFIYYGEWKNNCRSGWGVYQNKETSYKYKGNWKQDKKNGFGKEKTPSFTYEGEFKDDKKDGFGIIRLEGVRYDITWKNDKKHGKGKRFDANGQTEVYFLNGVESGGKGVGNSAEGQGKRDVSFLAKMFANK